MSLARPDVAETRRLIVPDPSLGECLGDEALSEVQWENRCTYGIFRDLSWRLSSRIACGRVSTAEIPQRRRRIIRGRLPISILLSSDVAAWAVLPETCFSTKQSGS